MRIKRAATLVCTFEGDSPVVHNFLTKQMFACNVRAIETLAVLDDWTDMEDVLARLPGPVDSTAAILKELLGRDLVLIEGSPAAGRDRHYQDNWRWGAVAGFYHFSLRDTPFSGGEAAVEKLREYGGPAASPPLLTSNQGLDTVVELPAFNLEDPFYSQLHKRRSRRKFSGNDIPLEALADCLFAGKGLVDILDSPEFGRLPLAMTPSGGARNPFELYVDVRRVSGLATGIYHYSTAEHTLGLLHDNERPAPAELLGKQDWADDCAAMIFLAATFERSAWKYRHALAYRVILMEVGAITQNIQLAASRTGIAAAPTGALAETAVETLLGLQEIEQAALFAVTLGDPA